MYLDSKDRRPAMTPQLALRVAIMGGFALVLFGIIFFRLWYLQVLSGDVYLAEANENRVREVKVLAPRGEIVDRDGTTLVDNRVSLAVQVSPDKLPRSQAEKTALYDRLADVVGGSRTEIRTRVRDQFKALPFSTATVETDVGLEVAQYIEEREDEFPGVVVGEVSLRRYPHKRLGAHLFGTVGEVNEEQLQGEQYRGVTQGDRVGQSGVEYAYDRFLRGENGASRVQVDALGVLRGELKLRKPVPGRQLRLSVDLDVQKAGQNAIGQDRRGAFVAMDIRNGEVRALGSAPSFDPNVFAKEIRQSDLDRLQAPENGAPLANRATQGLYSTGSTFKLITATAGLEGGLIGPDEAISDGGFVKIGNIEFENARRVANGSVSMRRALSVSSDVYFYLLGREANNTGNGHVLQEWAAKLGLGRETGIDLPGELPGLVPSPEWRNKRFKDGDTDRPWTVGDNVNLSVGQGDLQANPLQMAVAYATVANGGYVVTPHLGQRIEDGTGRVLQELSIPRRRKVDIAPEHRRVILDGLVSAANDPGGTSTAVFEGFPVKIAGKTGTAEVPSQRDDQSWYVALAPASNPRYVVAVTIEEGGFGAEAAAPAARKILAPLLAVKDRRKAIPKGESPD